MKNYVRMDSHIENLIISSKQHVIDQKPFLEKINFIKDLKILDIGTGTGVHLEYFKERGLIPTGLDRDGSGFLFKDTFELIISSSDTAEIEDESFDYVFASHVLEHCGDTMSTLLGWRKWIKPNGLLIVIVPPFSPYVANDHWNTGWNIGQLAMFLVAAGFDCSASSFMRVADQNVCGFGVKKEMPQTGFNINLSLPYLPKVLQDTRFYQNDGLDYLHGDITEALNIKVQPTATNQNNEDLSSFVTSPINVKNIQSCIIKQLDLNDLLSTCQLEKIDLKHLSLIREKSHILKKGSWTSLEYQNEILDALNRSAAVHAGPIIEIGSYHGGLTVQLAYFARKFNRDFYVIDILSDMLDITKQHLIDHDSLTPNIRFFHGTVSEFFNEHTFMYIPPCFVVVDALHTYYGARHDVCTILSNIPNAPVIGFHDFGLRTDSILLKENGQNPEIQAVDKAILDIIDKDINSLHPIGIIGEKSNERRTGYFEHGLPEGVLLFPTLLNTSAISTAYAYCSWYASKNK